MPYEYCIECEKEIDDWREGYLGCKHCGWRSLSDEDVLKELVREVGELREEIDEMFKVEKGGN